MTVYTVSQVTRHLKGLLRRDPLLQDLWISGEVSNLRVAASGHAYFTLKDAQSQLRAVMFNRSSGLELLGEGAAVTAHGYVSIYEVRGSLDFVTDVVVAEGMGPLALEFERLKAALASEGLFDPSRKRPLPRFPRRVGLVTSPAGAVLHDILKVINRRYPLVEVLFAPSAVQGAEAAAELVKALAILIADGRSDLIIMARGGGSMEDLWSFNEEAVARAIYSSPIPVVSAVGHETDFTIADFVADVRAPTPSAAAEMVTPDRVSLRMETAAMAQRMGSIIAEKLTRHGHELSYAVSELDHRAPDVDNLRRRVDDINHRAGVAVASALTVSAGEMNAVTARLQTLNPAATLNRGYAMVQKEPGAALVYRRRDAKPGDSLRVLVSDGAFGAAVKGRLARKPKAKKQPAGVPARLFP